MGVLTASQSGESPGERQFPVGGRRGGDGSGIGPAPAEERGAREVRAATRVRSARSGGLTRLGGTPSLPRVSLFPT